MTSASDLVGQWLHSHEDDGGGVESYRPADHPFPPSRLRNGFELRPEGSAVYRGIGQDDRPQTTEGSWTFDGERLRLDFETKPPISLKVVSHSHDELRVRREP